MIYGGGTLTAYAAAKAPTGRVQRVLWGTGSTVHGSRETPPVPPGFALAGTREWRGWEDGWVPCASCMSPLFDREYVPTRAAVLFVNAAPLIKQRYPLAQIGLPVMENTEPMERIVEFLGSAETVVTNSYHGVYWATLLRRKVVCIPYSLKFWAFRHPPAMSENCGADWRERAWTAKVYPDALAECRAANQRFYGRVREMI